MRHVSIFHHYAVFVHSTLRFHKFVLFSFSSFVAAVSFDHCTRTQYLYGLSQSDAVKDTQAISYFDPPIVWIALLCSLLLGFGDACINTQIYTMLAGSFASNSVAAFAVFKFTQVSEMGFLPSPSQSKLAMHEYQSNGDRFVFKVIRNT